jgi:ring-1,2-phenylacetyl-CoA epoxidase subunit PaaE
VTNFYTLKIKEVRQETEDCVSLLFNVPSDLQTKFKFVQGQYITLRAEINGEDLRRSYSICSSPYSGELRVAVKKIPDGKFSTYINQSFRAGNLIQVMPPMGSFYTPLIADQHKNYAAFAAGSGITPIMSIIRATLKVEQSSVFHLFYGNKSFQTIIFKSDLEELQIIYGDRLKVHHILSREDSIDPLFKGRITAEKCKSYHGSLFDVNTLNDVFLCGPEQMIIDLKDNLIELGLSETDIHFELFTSSKSLEERSSESDDKSSSESIISKVEVLVDGECFEFDLSHNGETILDAAIAVDADVPFACKGGVCCACKAKVMEGSVHMDVNYGLDEDEVSEGYILTCQAHPTSDKIIVDFDEF